MSRFKEYTEEELALTGELFTTQAEMVKQINTTSSTKPSPSDKPTLRTEESEDDDVAINTSSSSTQSSLEASTVGQKDNNSVGDNNNNNNNNVVTGGTSALILDNSWVKPPTYSGKPTEDVDDWILNFREAVAANAWKPEKAKAMFTACLKDSAKQWYRQYATEQGPQKMAAKSLGHLMVELRRTYQTVDDAFFRGNDFDRALQKKGESVIEYYIRLGDLARRSNQKFSSVQEQETLKRKFINGTFPHIREKLQINPHKSLEEIFTKAKQIEKSSAKYMKAVNFCGEVGDNLSQEFKPATPAVKQQDLEKKVGEWDEKFNKLTELVTKIALNQQGVQQGPPSQNKNTTKPAYKGKPKCKHCGSEHAAETCWYKHPELAPEWWKKNTQKKINLVASKLDTPSDHQEN